ncbi:hypothetical protein BKP45_03360 [Anaerobacillus alkalidiazotrophicus]|uniref:Acylphosphatase n=1 Tax=Anaerobacillus alkalidiazotrophicus TaxID=472963 RepID=A0A1S2MAQ6_9BACI|nr:acylphosphatase [Anaerobacillus alkalidiazotrophicus]OIJ21749.1 hypothetical protein BKP45_03360 [Anaerobacillus alkalidiazotrophicus]
MEIKKNVWLPHLSDEVVSDATGHELCPYLVALEGWRRGLTLKWYTNDANQFHQMKTWFVDKPGKLFSLSSEDRTHYFFRTRGDKVSNEAVEIGADKQNTKNWLSKVGVPVPVGKRFASTVSNEDVFNEALTIGFPLVVKPTDGSFGRGVMTNIQTEEELQYALIYVRSELNYPDIIIEKYIQGEDYRLYVVGDKVIGAMRRIPANVTGDGSSTIAKLIDLKNEQRKQNPRLISCPIKIDHELKGFIEQTGYTIDSVPKKGEQIFVRETSNISLGGDPINATGDLSPEIKTIAIEAVKAIPGLHHCGVDMIFDQKNPTSAVVIELNPTAQIGSLLFPMEGQASDIPAAIIDYYFPETVNVEKTNHYFDFKSVLQPLTSKTAIVVEVASAPLGYVYAKKYTVSGDVHNVTYHQWLRKQALERSLNGYIKIIHDELIEVVVGGTNKEEVDQFQHILNKDPRNYTITNISSETWKKPIRIGFEIQAELKELVAEVKKMNKELEKLEKERIRVEKKYLKLQNNRLWRLTLPIRKLLDILKGIFKPTN